MDVFLSPPSAVFLVVTLPLLLGLLVALRLVLRGVARDNEFWEMCQWRLHALNRPLPSRGVPFTLFSSSCTSSSCASSSSVCIPVVYDG